MTDSTATLDPTDEAAPDAGSVPDDAVEVAETPADEMAIILGVGDTLTLRSGTRVHIKPLRFRELAAALQVILAGVGPDMFATMDPDAPTGELVGKFGSLLLMGMVTATDQMAGFLRQLCEPADLPIGALDKAQKARVADAVARLHAELDNPDPQDLVRIVGAVAARDGADLAALGKLLAWVIRTLQRSGVIPRLRTSRA